MATVRIEGVEFSLSEAAELAERARRQSAGTARPGLNPSATLATQVEHHVGQGGGTATLTDAEKGAAYAVVDEWRQRRQHPAGVDVLHRLLAPE